MKNDKNIEKENSDDGRYFKYLVTQIIQMKKNILKQIRMKKITLIILKKNSKNQLELLIL